MLLGLNRLLETTWSPKIEEDLARLWEAYVSSPNSVKNSIPGRIKILLQKLADLMKQVYRTLRNGVALDPEIARAYNKLMNLEENNKAENTGNTAESADAVMTQDSRKKLQDNTDSPAGQYEAVRNQYEGTDQWMKAPNGADTKLTERQWIQVRTPNFIKWFGDWINDPQNASKMVDENGEPKVFYHGTSKDFDTFTHDMIGSHTGNYGMYGYGFYFSDRYSVATGYGNNVISAFLNVRNHIVEHGFDFTKYDGIIDAGEKVDTVNKEKLLERLLGKNESLDQLVKDTYEFGYDSAWDLFYSRNGLVNVEQFTGLEEAFIDKFDTALRFLDKYNYIPYVNDYSYDVLNEIAGDVFEEQYKYKRPLVFALDAGKNIDQVRDFTSAIKADGYDGVVSYAEVMVPDSNQIKSATGNNGDFYLNNDSIYYQDNDGSTTVQKKNGSLVIVHSMSEGKLRGVIDVGGMPMPSLAITAPKAEVLEPTLNYGEITFIGNSKLAGRVIGSGAVWDRDIWSPTYPQAQYKMNKKGISNELRAIQRNYSKMFDWTHIADSWMEHQYATPEDLILKLKDPGRYPAIALQFLSENGKTVDIPHVPKAHELYSARTLMAARQWLETNKYLTDSNWSELYDSLSLGSDIINAYPSADLPSADSRFFSRQEKYQKRMEYINKIKNDPDLGFNRSYDTAEAIVQASSRSSNAIDYYALGNILEEAINKSEFQTWLERKFNRFYSEPMLKIGNTWKPYNLENIVKYMEKQGVVGATATGFSTDGELAAISAKNLKTREEIR